MNCEIPLDWREERVPARTLDPVNCEIAHQLERGTSASEDAGPQRRWIVRSHVNWRGERVSERTLTLKGGGFEIPRRLDRGTSVREDVGPWREVDLISQIDWIGEQVPARTLGPKGKWIWYPRSIGEGNECQRGRSALKGGGVWDPTSIEEGNECQRERWAPKGGGLWDPKSIEEGNECQRECWATKEGGLWDPTLIGKRNKTLFIRVWKLLPSQHVLKTLRGSPKGKVQRRQYGTISTSRGLGCHKITL